MNNKTSLFPPFIEDACCFSSCSHEQTGYERHFFITPKTLLKSVQKLDSLGYYLEDIVASQVKEGFLLVYHFNHWETPGRLVLRVLLTEGKKEVESISSVYPGALWHERECYDFFGIIFKNHPNLIPLLLDPENPIDPPLLKPENKKKDLYQLLPACEQVLQHPRDEELSNYLIECSKKG
ncbi:NADH-quinone oxidoreductase subunit C [Desulfonauticus submarinus]|uniref:NADH-quinone oxidoreductase subunit C n=1 Tax=Desulfonauticus submarinus TaxID=206665 RepID=A0A1H0GFY0_9BACT|nr:NADH-quinone oxidoreductase subunit C [Desulfonauticus submarinus]SDO05784.1 NADH-quinone oxidoreductase subunit C [Desulfonauticus submarinus]